MLAFSSLDNVFFAKDTYESGFYYEYTVQISAVNFSRLCNFGESTYYLFMHIVVVYNTYWTLSLQLRL